MRIVLSAAALAALLAGCSSTGSAASRSAASSAASAPQGRAVATEHPPAAVPTEPGRIDIGTTFELMPASGALDVTVLKVAAPATPADPRIKPVAGQQWVGVELRFANKGGSEFDDNLYTLGGFDSQSRELSIQITAEIAAGPSIPLLSGLHLAPGDSQTGWVVFEVPSGAVLSRVQYGPPGTRAARWTVG